MSNNNSDKTKHFPIQDDFEGIFNDLISLVPIFFRKFKDMSTNLLEDYGITRAQLGILFTLKPDKRLTVTELGKILKVAKPNITTLIDRLVELKFVSRKEGRSDRRICLIELTEKGSAVLEGFQQKFKTHVLSGLWNLDTNDLKELRDSLKVMKKILDKIPQKK